MGYAIVVMNGHLGFSPLMGEQPQPGLLQISPNPFRIRTSAKSVRNSFRIRTSKTKDLKSFRIRTYENKRGGAPCSTGNWLPIQTLSAESGVISFVINRPLRGSGPPPVDRRETRKKSC